MEINAELVVQSIKQYMQRLIDGASRSSPNGHAIYYNNGYDSAEAYLLATSPLYQMCNGFIQAGLDGAV